MGRSMMRVLGVVFCVSLATVFTLPVNEEWRHTLGDSFIQSPIEAPPDPTSALKAAAKDAHDAAQAVSKDQVELKNTKATADAEMAKAKEEKAKAADAKKASVAKAEEDKKAAEDAAQKAVDGAAKAAENAKA